jgi:hypothetical protein
LIFRFCWITCSCSFRKSEDIWWQQFKFQKLKLWSSIWHQTGIFDIHCTKTHQKWNFRPQKCLKVRTRSLLCCVTTLASSKNSGMPHNGTFFPNAFCKLIAGFLLVLLFPTFPTFLAHLSWKLKWAFLIVFCPSSFCPSVRPSVCKLLHFRLLQNHWANFNQTWHKWSLGRGDSKLFKWRGLLFSKGR